MRRALPLLGLLAGCDSCGKESALPPKPAPIEAAVAAPKPLADRDALESLLAWTDSRVAVSSTVENPRDFPEHLIDGKPDTAWNGNTGDLLGGWIAFRVPEAAYVKEVRITCGFDKIAADGTDLFTANQRIARIQIRRKTAVGGDSGNREYALDTNRRGPQTIPVDARGGDFYLTVSDVLPGTKKDWRELVVSELQVLGTAGPAKLGSPHMPRVRIGSLDAPERGAKMPERPSSASFASLDAFCASFVSTAKPVMDELSKDDSPWPCRGMHAECKYRDDARIFPANARPFLEARTVATSAKNDRVAVALRTPNGWFPAALVLEDGDRCVLGDAGTSSSKVVGYEPQDGYLEIVTETRTAAPSYLTDEDGGHAIVVEKSAWRTRYRCENVDGAPKCESKGRLAHWDGTGDAEPPADVSKWTQD
jgi:hypothetical protein